MALLGVRLRLEGRSLTARTAPLYPAVVGGQQPAYLVGVALVAGRRRARVHRTRYELGGGDPLRESRSSGAGGGGPRGRPRGPPPPGPGAAPALRRRPGPPRPAGPPPAPRPPRPPP